MIDAHTAFLETHKVIEATTKTKEYKETRKFVDEAIKNAIKQGVFGTNLEFDKETSLAVLVAISYELRKSGFVVTTSTNQDNLYIVVSWERNSLDTASILGADYPF